MKRMLVVKIEKCLGCKSCELACAIRHSKSGELFQAIQERPAPQPRVRVGQGEGFAVPLQCRQCEDAPCATVCPTAALHRNNPDSPVVLDTGLCIGCTWCVLACPFGVITLDEQRRAIVKCDQCFDRVERGELPACVEGCPSGALEFKTMDEVTGEKRAAWLQSACMLQIERSAAGGGTA